MVHDYASSSTSYAYSRRPIMSNQAACIMAGALFAAGWWIWLDVWIVSRIQKPEEARINGWSCLPGILSSIALIWINMIPSELLQRDAYIAADEEMARARCAILTAFTAGFAGLLTSLWWWLTDLLSITSDNHHFTLVNTSILSAVQHNYDYNPVNDIYDNESILDLKVGWVVLVQNALIFISTFILRFGRSEADV
ncbi:hypothetical protein BDF19DRAFT_423828 [Syncephalis fuscata]|nr:hypothetical protein BDF19DRAFT_423828 [Syncephalis fuscata]